MTCDRNPFDEQSLRSYGCARMSGTRCTQRNVSRYGMPCPPKPRRPKSATTSSPTIRPSPVGPVESVEDVRQVMNQPPADVPLGSTCTSRSAANGASSATSKSSPTNELATFEHYMAALSREIELVSQLPVMGDRPFRFVYFGGGTPSFLSVRQLTSLVDRLRENIDWAQAEEVTFECEPGTLGRTENPGAQGTGSHAFEPGRGELQRRRAQREWPSTFVGRDLPGLGVDPGGSSFPTSISI